MYYQLAIFNFLHQYADIGQSFSNILLRNIDHSISLSSFFCKTWKSQWSEWTMQVWKCPNVDDIF